jgi:hypothetical protein
MIGGIGGATASCELAEKEAEDKGEAEGDCGLPLVTDWSPSVEESMKEQTSKSS